MRRTVLATIAAATVAAAVLAPGASAGPGTTVIYDNTPNPQPGNIASWGFEATGTSELGDQVQFAGTGRSLNNVKVIMSSWACQTGHWTTGDCWSGDNTTAPVQITFSIYGVGSNGTDVIYPAIASSTQTFNIPYRPSADPACASMGFPGKWQASDGNCYNGYATPITFNFPGTALPDKVIYGISYTTSTNNGPGVPPSAPSDPGCATTAGCFVDSLNVGLWNGPSVGSRPVGDGNYNYVNATSQYHSTYCDNGFAGTDSFRLNSVNTSQTGDCQGQSPSSPDWFGSGAPAVQFNAVTPGPTCPNAANSTFTNQTINGNLTVPAGMSYCLDHSTVMGDITVGKGSSLTMINGSTGGHDVKGTNVGSVTIDSSTVNHDVVFSGATGPISVTNSKVLHDLNLTGNKGGVTVSSNTIGHDLNVKSNTGGTTVTGNTVSHVGTCNGNTPFSGSGNSATAASCNTA